MLWAYFETGSKNHQSRFVSTTFRGKKMLTNLFADWTKPAVHPDRPLRIVFLTSVRDTGACDCNGLNVYMPDGIRYMEGAIQRTVLAARPGGMLHGLIEVVLVITDDHPKDKLRAYPCAPQAGRPWLHPHDLRLANGQRVTERTINQPSSFRKLPKTDRVGRKRAKLEFERSVLTLFQEVHGDVLVSDHYMAQIDHLITAEFGLMGRVINIHPAITVRESPHCLRGPTPTTDALVRARDGVHTVTGATLHFVNEVIDDGGAIAMTEGTPVYASDKPQWLRSRNYRLAKLPLFVSGLRHYVIRLYPHLDNLDLTQFTPRVL
ncbi:MAG: formyltransferase family protein [bacterium]|nr:formyltransferase family protein [bacterium]